MMGGMLLTVEQVMESLSQVMDPELGRNIVDLGMVRNVTVSPKRIGFTLALTTLGCPLRGRIVEDARRVLSELGGDLEVDIQLAEMSGEEKDNRWFLYHGFAGEH